MSAPESHTLYDNMRGSETACRNRLQGLRRTAPWAHTICLTRAGNFHTNKPIQVVDYLKFQPSNCSAVPQLKSVIINIWSGKRKLRNRRHVGRPACGDDAILVLNFKIVSRAHIGCLSIKGVSGRIGKRYYLTSIK